MIERMCFILIFLVQKWKQRCENDLKISSKNENSETCSEKTTDNSVLFFSGLLWSHFPKKFNLEGYFVKRKKIKQLSSDCWEIKIVRRKKDQEVRGNIRRNIFPNFNSNYFFRILWWTVEWESVKIHTKAQGATWMPVLFQSVIF